MKTFRKTVSFVLAFAMCLTMTVSFKTDAAKEPENPLQYVQMLWDEGYVPVSTDTIVAVIRHFGKVLSFFTHEDIETKKFNLRFDAFTSDLCAYICSESGLDLEKREMAIAEIERQLKLLCDAENIAAYRVMQKLGMRMIESNPGRITKNFPGERREYVFKVRL